MQELETQLKQIESEWNAISISFSGAAPSLEAGSEDFPLERSLIGQRESEEVVDFVEAWHCAVSRARALISTKLQTWSRALLNSNRITFDPRQIPEPPQDIPVCDTGSLAAITGTPDVIEGGARIVFWCAADLNPIVMRREPNHQVLFHRWTGQLLEVLEGKVRTTRCIMPAVSAFFDAYSPEVASAEQNGQEAKVAANIRKVGKKRFLILFGDIEHFVNDKSGERLVRVLSERTVSLVSLMDGNLALDESAQRKSEFDENPEDAVRTARALRNLIEKNNNALTKVTDAEARLTLEHEIKRAKIELNGLDRIPKSKEQKAIDSIMKGFGRIRKALNASEIGRELAEHIRKYVEVSPNRESIQYTGDIHWQLSDSD